MLRQQKMQLEYKIVEWQKLTCFSVTSMQGRALQNNKVNFCTCCFGIFVDIPNMVCCKPHVSLESLYNKPLRIRTTCMWWDYTVNKLVPEDNVYIY